MGVQDKVSNEPHHMPLRLLQRIHQFLQNAYNSDLHHQLANCGTGHAHIRTHSGYWTSGGGEEKRLLCMMMVVPSIRLGSAKVGTESLYQAALRAFEIRANDALPEDQMQRSRVLETPNNSRNAGRKRV